MLRVFAWAMLLLLPPARAGAQDIDVLHYEFRLSLSDSSDNIQGNAGISLKLLRPSRRVALDLSEVKNGRGMRVHQVTGSNVKGFEHQGDRLAILLDEEQQAGKRINIQIQYSGIPSDGLIISENKYGERTFFADNWPNRAHCWIPCNDRPDDKASFEFFVAVPNHYQVVSNGILVQDSVKGDWEERAHRHGRYFHWREEIPLSTKVMVIGAARFAIKDYGNSFDSIPVSAWVFPKDSTKGFYDYALAPGILEFFSKYIAPYPFKKLANVQSKTIFGGMENASAIFYAENSVTGNRSSEDLLAHEIAHQWFGDMVSEKSFTHLWLSEGFATYLTNIYLEQAYGKEVMINRMEEDREQVRAFAKQSSRAVVDSLSPFMSLLNPNSYQKGGWVLHMLRGEVGDSLFREILGSYYQQYKGGNAATGDFEGVAEKVSGKELSWFFNQWLFQPGLPVLKLGWSYDKGRVVIRNHSAASSRRFCGLRTDLLLVFEDGSEKHSIILDTGDAGPIEIITGKKPQKIILDPDVKLLYEGGIWEGRKVSGEGSEG